MNVAKKITQDNDELLFLINIYMTKNNLSFIDVIKRTIKKGIDESLYHHVIRLPYSD